MPSFSTHLTPTQRRRLAVGAAVFAVLLLAGFFARLPLAGFGTRTLLELLGADEIRLVVVDASPWRVVLRDVEFHVRTRSYAAGGMVFERKHWWTPSLGTVRITQARVTVNIDGSDTNPWTWASYHNGIARVRPLGLPLEEIYAEGRLLVQAAGVANKPLAVRFAGQRTNPKLWSGQIQAAGDGLKAAVEVTMDPATDAVGFKLTEFSLDVAVWQEFLQRLVLLPGGKARLAGQVTGRAGGRLAGKKLELGGTLHLRDGRYQHGSRSVAAEGVEFDLEIVDSAKFQTKPGSLRVGELRAGGIVLRDLEAGFAFENANQIVVSRATLTALGGRGSVEPFNYFLDQRWQLDLSVLVARLDLRAVLALAPELPAKATGRVDGRLPLHIDDTGVRLGQGWLALTPGTAAELEFTSPGLLTTGKGTDTPGHVALKKVEAGLLAVKLGELRLDIRPSDAPRGCAAILHVAGETVGAEAVPVKFDCNVNSPVERFINVVPDSRSRP